METFVGPCRVVNQHIHMADEAGHELSSIAAPRSSGRAGVTDCAATGSSPTGRLVPEKARSVATSETRTDDEHVLSRSSTPTSQRKRKMSRAPLLVRSSPAQGTGKLASEVHLLHLT